MQEAQPGQLWQSPEGASWRVIKVTENSVHFTGPGPFRSVKVESRAVVEGGWEFLGWHPRYRNAT